MGRFQPSECHSRANVTRSFNQAQPGSVCVPDLIIEAHDKNTTEFSRPNPHFPGGILAMDNQSVERTWARRGFLATLLAVIAVALLFPQLTKADAPEEAQNPNFAVNAAAAAGAVAFDVSLPPGTDLLAYTRESLNRGPDDYVAPLMVPAADFNGDSQTSDYFFSFGTGRYGAGDGCHMAPVYLPHGGSGTTVTVDNFFIFAYDNDVSNITTNLWRKQSGSTNAPTQMGTVTTAGASTSIQILGDTTIVDPVVTSDYFYYITWCWGGTGVQQGIQGFWIFYTES